MKIACLSHAEEAERRTRAGDGHLLFPSLFSWVIISFLAITRIKLVVKISILRLTLLTRQGACILSKVQNSSNISLCRICIMKTLTRRILVLAESSLHDASLEDKSAFQHSVRDHERQNKPRLIKHHWRLKIHAANTKITSPGFPARSLSDSRIGSFFYEPNGSLIAPAGTSSATNQFISTCI